MNAPRKLCPWCRAQSDRGKLCADCENQATSLGRLSAEELDRLPYGAIRVGADGVILSVNRAERALSGLEPKDYLGRNFFEIAPCTKVRAFSGRWRRFLHSDKRTHEFNFIYQIKGRGNFAVRVTFVRLPDGALILASQKVRNHGWAD